MEGGRERMEVNKNGGRREEGDGWGRESHYRINHIIVSMHLDPA